LTHPTTPHRRGEEANMVARASGRPYGALGRIGIVAGFHAAVILLVANSMGFHPLKLPEDMTGVVLSDPSIPPPLPPPVIPTQQTATDVFVPAPVDPTYESDSQNTITAQRVDPDHVPVEVTPPQPATNLVGIQNDPRHPLTQPPYPQADIREGNEGSAIVEIFVRPDGRIGDARIVKSTGFASLDRATLEEARRNWRMKPATRDGVAFGEWHRLSVVFRLQNR
jgi:protein TonB